MKRCVAAGAAVLAAALSQAAVAPAFAEEPAPQFRSAERQTFTAEDLQRYGLSAEDAERAIAYQDQGYELKVMTREEAEQYTAGLTDNEALLVGILVVVVIALVV
jgi:hypothetical protein